jgi:hypothetical protein
MHAPPLFFSGDYRHLRLYEKLDLDSKTPIGGFAKTIGAAKEKTGKPAATRTKSPPGKK